MSATADSELTTPELVSVRMERLAFSHYHLRILSIVGTRGQRKRCFR